MRRTGYTVTVILALLAFGVGFLGVTAGLDLTQSVNPDNVAVTDFAVWPGEGSSAVATHLEQQGLIRNALVFRMLASTRHLDAHLRPGTYQLSPDMTSDVILQQFAAQQPGPLPIVVPPGKVLVLVPPGVRVAQLPLFAAGLPRFDAQRFANVTTSGILPDGKHLSDLYWYVRPKQPNVVAALEGYILPGVYFFTPADDDVAVVNTLLTALGEQLCPGPDAGHPDAYLHDATQCKAHAATAGPTHANLFTEMEHHFGITDDVLALYDTLTVASLVVRISSRDGDAAGVADVYMNRYQASHTHAFTPSGDYVENLDAIASVQYARDSAAPPADDLWWAPLADLPTNIASDSPYNSALPGTTGLVPGPIAAATWPDVLAVAAANEPSPSPNFFVVADRCGHAQYSQSLAKFLVVAQNAQAGCTSR